MEEGTTGTVVVPGGTGVVDPPSVDDATGVVGTPGVVDPIGVTGLVAGIVPVLVSTTMEPSEFVVVTAVVKVFGVED